MGEAAALRPLASGKPHGEWFGLAGIAVMALPTLLSLGRETWSTEAGAHGPIVLATGHWPFLRFVAEWVGAAPPGYPSLSGHPLERDRAGVGTRVPGRVGLGRWRNI